MSNSCNDIRSELIECIKESECMLKGQTFHECLKSKDLDKECVVLRQGYGDCRRGWLDMRHRLTGNSPGKTEAQREIEKENQLKGIRTEPKSVSPELTHLIIEDEFLNCMNTMDSSKYEQNTGRSYRFLSVTDY